MISLEKVILDGHVIKCDVIPMGNDFTVAVYGGEKPHVGSVVISRARPSLTGEGVSVSSSVINGMGHKEEAIARMFAETVAVRKRCTAVCTCGIHIDEITPEQIQMVNDCCKKILEEIFSERQMKV